MLIPTGNTEDRPCRCCGRVLPHREGAVHKHTGDEDAPLEWVTIWRTTLHDAPCGLPCFGAGVPGDVYKSGQFHNTGKCPRCNPKSNPSPAVSGHQRSV